MRKKRQLRAERVKSRRTIEGTHRSGSYPEEARDDPTHAKGETEATSPKNQLV